MYEFPDERPLTVVECDVEFVLENVLLIDAYAVEALVLYLHVAVSLVVSESVVVVAVEASAPVGEPAERTGAVESGEIWRIMTLSETVSDVVVVPESGVTVTVPSSLN